MDKSKYDSPKTRTPDQVIEDGRAAAVNADRELWREREDDYYSPSIHVTAGGGIGINVSGTVYVRKLSEWHSLLHDNAIPPRTPADEEVEQLRVQLAGVLTASYGATHNPATQGQYGWSPAYQSVLELRLRFDQLVKAVQSYCGQDGRDGNRAIQKWFSQHGIGLSVDPPEPDTCHECGELAVGFDEGTPLCAAHYRAKPAFWENKHAQP